MQNEVKLPVWRRITSSSSYCVTCSHWAVLTRRIVLMNYAWGVFSTSNRGPEFSVSAIPRKSWFEHQCLLICHRPWVMRHARPAW